MTWIGLGLLLALAAHALVSTVVAALVAAVRPVAVRLLRRAAPGPRADGLFALALAPSTAGLAAVLAVVLPAWVAGEPRGTIEPAGGALWMSGLAGAALVVVRLACGVRLACRTARASADWIRGGVPVPGLALPSTLILRPLPVAALVGFLRPRLLLSDRLVAALDGPELEAVAAHEAGHAEARDNLRRLLLAASPDVLAWLPPGVTLRRELEEAAEAAADRRALARVRPETLARALVKAARLVPVGHRLELPLVAFDGTAPFADRVRALLRAEPGVTRPRRVRPLALAAAALALAALAALSAARPEAHAALEALVRALA